MVSAGYLARVVAGLHGEHKHVNEGCAGQKNEHVNSVYA